MTDFEPGEWADDEYPPGSLAADMRKLAIEAENLKRLLVAEIVKTLGPLIDYMARVGRR